LIERIIQQAARWSDEWFSLFVFLIAGHLAKQNQAAPARTFAEDCLCCVPIKIATSTVLSSPPQCAEI
jgi:hypothetical protein